MNNNFKMFHIMNYDLIIMKLVHANYLNTYLSKFNKVSIILIYFFTDV